MTSKERVLQREHDKGKPAGKLQGRADALELAARAADMDGTAIIAEEGKVPEWSEKAVYTADHVGFPVRDMEQVYKLIMPHTPAHNPGSRPADLPAIYSLLHTKDPAKAKPWAASHGISGLYMTDECCTYPHAGSGKLHVWRCTVDNNEYPPQTQGVESRWVDMGLA